VRATSAARSKDLEGFSGAGAGKAFKIFAIHPGPARL